MLRFAALLALSTAGNAAVTRNDAELELKSAYDAWIAAINRGDNESGMAVFTDDGAIIGPVGPLPEGRKQLNEFGEMVTKVPGLHIAVTTLRVSVTADGTTGFVVGDGEITMPRPDGKLVTSGQRLLTVWRKQGGIWHCYIDAPIPSDAAAKIGSN